MSSLVRADRLRLTNQALDLLASDPETRDAQTEAALLPHAPVRTEAARSSPQHAGYRLDPARVFRLVIVLDDDPQPA